jgi:KUP system potassium uptake protein
MDRRSPVASLLGAPVIGALGVVFGDIGTSPSYAQQSVFAPGDPHPVAVSRTTVYGVTSLIVRSVVAIVTVTYVLLVMRAGNEGEGGIMALITLVRRNVAGRTSLVLAALGIFGASPFLGDSMITPAISVLSAVEGLKTVSPGLSHVVIPITVVVVVVVVVVIIGLFLVQRRGASAVGRLFGPVMVIWLAMIAALGVKGVVLEPAILRALQPWEAIHFVAAGLGVPRLPRLRDQLSGSRGADPPRSRGDQRPVFRTGAGVGRSSGRSTHLSRRPVRSTCRW